MNSLEQDDSTFLGSTYTLHLHRSKGYGDGVRGYGIQFEPRELGPTVTLVRLCRLCTVAPETMLDLRSCHACD